MLHHGSGRDDGRLAHGIHHHQPQHYSQYHQRPQPHLDIQSALNTYHYPAQQPVQYTYQPPPQSPPSPPVEDLNKPSLPSISSLLGIAGGERDTQEAGQQQQQAQQVQQQQKQEAQQYVEQRMQRQSQQPGPSAAPPQDPRVENIHHGYNPGAANHKMTLPPTPPLQPDSAVDGNHSPSTISSHSSLSAPPYYLGQSLNNVEPHQQRQPIPSQGIVKRHSLPLQTSVSPYTTSPYATSPYATSPASAPGYYSPENQVYSAAGMYHQQRPLPSNFPPPPVAVNMPPNPPGSGPNPWQHHHYISASSQAAFPQSQDRYICQTCNKAFSRPSSLRIHSHSHTGEKPFKCPHSGCGKAFSVRSNMKRHERGCHANPGASISAS